MFAQWLETSRDQFKRLRASLPHALLIHGEPGVGKSLLAMEIVSALLCDSPVESERTHTACGECHNCVLFESGNHPDFHYVSSEAFVDLSPSSHLSYAERYLEDAARRSKRKSRRLITIEQIRDLIESFALSRHSAAHKVALLQPAGAMNINAANALLKLLEEPSSQSILILVSHQASDLPETIRSRCVEINVDTPEREQSVAWLKAQGHEVSIVNKALSISNGAPLVAQAYCESEEVMEFEALLVVLAALLGGELNAIDARTEILKLKNSPIVLSWLQLIMKWLIVAPQSGDGENTHGAWRAFLGAMSPLAKVIQNVDQSQLFRSYDDLVELKKQDVNIVNFSLILDKWLISFSQRCTPGKV